MIMDFVSFELSKKLKEKGFPLVDYIPTISKVLKWLREEKHLHIELVAAAYGYNFIVSQTPENGGTDYYSSAVGYDGPNDGGAWDSYESAALAGIEYVIDNLI